MRIQHNIMAMSAYRNYTNNVSAMKKNLEKLSSGYKINRAGDDAAGLAISEKMRAQITGLETAQKNAKDGISLVQTAEGALTEVHDMLNRMVELATQSANGTYDNETDRYQLQKEMDQLRAEIDRIADSSNFNGINLLDGSMDAGGDVTYTTGSFEVTGEHATSATGAIQLPTKGTVLGTNTVVHSDAITGNDKNVFSVDLHNLQLAAGGKVDITIGSDTFTMKTAATEDMDAQAIAKLFATSAGFVDSQSADVDPTQVTIGSSVYKVTASGTRLTFEQTTDGGDDIPQNVSIVDSDVAAAGYTPVGMTVTGTPSADFTDGVANTSAPKLEIDLSGLSVDKAGTLTISAAGKDYEVEVTQTMIDNSKLSTGATPLDEAIAAALKTAIDADKPTDDTTTGAWTTAVNGAVVSLTGASNGVADSALSETVSVAEKSAPDGNLTGDYNFETTVIETKQANAAERLASTKFTLTDEMTSEGSQITIGRDTYTFTTDKSKIGKDGYVVFNEGDSLDKKAQLLTKAAENNKTYTVGHTGTGGDISVVEIPDQTNFDLTTVEGIEKSLGFKTASTNPVDNSKGLTLQIGPTADSYNQLKVNIKDCHVKALGIGDIDISTQDGAQEAVDAIKAAINYVSDVRGTLGATQNRLDHTINNLSVMTENIQDAESTIRDVDVAEEMMAYTKNNILIQSAQAMLAQANQVPQGVLQLLQ